MTTAARLDGEQHGLAVVDRLHPQRARPTLCRVQRYPSRCGDGTLALLPAPSRATPHELASYMALPVGPRSPALVRGTHEGGL